MTFFGKKRIYADWAATTPLHGKIKRAMKKAEKFWANPSAIHKEGTLAKRALEEARLQTARILGVKPDEVYFTSGGTESNATIIRGVVEARMEKGIKPEDIHIVSSTIEHSSVLKTLKELEDRGMKVDYVNPDQNGTVTPQSVQSFITPQTTLVIVMYANNEIGTIEPVSKIGAMIRKMRAENMSLYPVFMTDASQAPLWLSCDPEGLRADAMTLDAHKMQGPKGIGAMIVRRHVSFKPMMMGGGQERGKRSTTESVVLATGFSEALALAQEGRQERFDKVKKITDYFIEKISKEIPEAVLNGSKDKRLPNNVNISLEKISDPELVVLFLDKEGIAISTKSSCQKGEEMSYVVKALGGREWRARNTLRFTFAPNASKKDVCIIMEVLKKVRMI